jgi:hypothetical protein
VSVTGAVHIGATRRAAIAAGTIVSLVALALLPLLAPLFTHPALDLAGSATLLGLDGETTRDLSDRSVEELVTGPGTFLVAMPDGTPMYDEAERGHLRDARLLLWLTLGAGVLAAVLIGLDIGRSTGRARASRWLAVAQGGGLAAAGVLVIGLVSLFAFGTLLTLFHQVFFPGGNWAFDPSSQRLVQLYPFEFWRLAAAALGGLVALLGMGAWLLGRWRAGRVSPADTRPASGPASPGGRR